MKKIVLIIAVLLMLASSACSARSAMPNEADNADDSLFESITMLDNDVWPANEYTDGLPIPSGTVAWAMLDTAHENCSVNITGIDESSFNDYMALLKQEGFSLIEDVSEKINGQSYVSIGTLLSDNDRWLSVSYIPDMLTLYISFAE